MASLSMVDMGCGQRPSLVLVMGHGGCSFDQALAITGAHVAERLHWTDVTEELSWSVRDPVFLLDAIGVDEDLLADVLPRLDEAATRRDAAVVVGIDERRIDVTAMLLGPRRQILCRPDLGEQVGALTIAAELMGRPPGVSDTAAEGEAARLERLNEEVARIAEVLARLTRRTGPDPATQQIAAADRRMSFGSQPSADLLIEPGEVRRGIRARRLRDQFFGANLFEEPGWDMMLDLFAAELERTRVSVSSLCIAAAVAPTTALRWISKMVDAGLFERHPDPFDRRRAFMELSQRASEAMRTYVGALRRAGLSLG